MRHGSDATLAEIGRVAAIGPVRDVVNAYQRTVGEREQRERAARGEVGARWGSKEIEIVRARILGPTGEERAVLDSGELAVIEIAYRNPASVRDAVFGVYVYRDGGVGVYGTNTLIDGCDVPVRPEGVARFAIDALDLFPGAYDVDVGIIDAQDRSYDHWQKGLAVRVIGRSREVGLARMRHRWEFD